MITQKELKEILDYNKESGLFTWKVSNNRRVKSGDRAGTFHKASGYIVIEVNAKKYYAHRLAFLYMEGEFPPEQIDHRDRNRDNNIWSNLRPATNQENSKNKTIATNNKSGVSGVSWNKRACRWVAYIRGDGKRVNLGYFTEYSEAVNARKNAEVLYGYYNPEESVDWI